MNKTYTFHVSGMHCKACVLMTESELQDVPAIASAKTSLSKNSVEITGDFGEKSQTAIAEELSLILAKNEYSLSVEKKITSANWSEFTVAIPVALAFGVAFILLQKAGLVNVVNTSSVTYGTAFFIGIIASLSTCMAVVGGLVLSMSATFAKEGNTVQPQVLFHVGRIVSFAILGGVIGTIGSAFTLNTSMTVTLNILIGIVMLIMGINLLDVFHWAKKLQPTMPKFIAKHAHGISKINHTLTPLLVGIATFFLPCGFTQSMQLYALSTGSFITGSLTMLAFAVGTLPVLALVSFSSLSIKNHKKSGVFFKTAGLIVIMFAVFNLINSMVISGFIAPVFNF